jgi:hypothetical protein
LAKRDIAGVASAKEQVKLADAWWDAGGNLRAVYWYRQALPELTGLERDRVEKRSARYPVSASGTAKAPSPEYLTPERRKANLLVDGSFEGRPLQNWSIRSWRGNTKAVQIDSNEAKVGRQSAVFRPTEPDDVMFTQVVAVKPKTRYLFYGWAKTQDIVVEKGQVNRGATLSLWGGFESSRSLSASNDWTYLELVFDSGERTSVEVGARLGHHGSRATGTAWFDDLCLIERGESSKGYLGSERQYPTIVGVWDWDPIGTTATFYEDQTCKYSLGNRGKWTHPNAAARRYEVSWSNGFIDTVTLSPDGNELNVNNNAGGRFTAKRR